MLESLDYVCTLPGLVSQFGGYTGAMAYFEVVDYGA